MSRFDDLIEANLRTTDAIRLAKGLPKGDREFVVRMPDGTYVRSWHMNLPSHREFVTNPKHARAYSAAGAADIARRSGGTIEPWAFPPRRYSKSKEGRKKIARYRQRRGLDADVGRFDSMIGLTESHSKRDISGLEAAFKALAKDIRGHIVPGVLPPSPKDGKCRNVARVTQLDAKHYDRRLKTLEREILKLKRSAE